MNSKRLLISVLCLVVLGCSDVASNNPIASNNDTQLKLEAAVASNNKLIETLQTQITGNSVSVNGQILEKLETIAENIKIQLGEIRNSLEVKGDNNKVNDPYIAWILAIIQPLTFLLYLGLHRFQSFRKIKDKIRGRDNSEHNTSDNGSD